MGGRFACCIEKKKQGHARMRSPASLATSGNDQHQLAEQLIS